MTPDQFLELARLLPEPMLLVSGDGHILAANPRAAEIAGGDNRDLTGKNLADLVVDPSAKVADYLHACSRNREVTLGSLAFSAGDGERIEYRLEGAVARPWSEGAPALMWLRMKPKQSAAAGFLLLNEKIDQLTREIAERKRAEEERARLLEQLESDQKLLQAILQQMPAGVLIAEAPTGKLIFGNDRMEQIFRHPFLPAETVEDYTRYKILHVDGRPLRAEEFPLARSIKTGDIVIEEELRFERYDGTSRTIRASSAPIRDRDDKILAAVVTFYDITDQQMMAYSLREQTEAVETVNRIGRVLTAEMDLQKLVQAVTDAATELSGARFGSFFYNAMNREGEAYMLYTLSGVPREAFAHFPMPRATNLFGPTFRGEATIRIDDVKKDARYGKNSPYYGMPVGHLPVTSYLAVPVISRSGKVLGGLFFGHPERGAFTERHEQIVEGLAAQAAIAMDNAQLLESAEHARRQAEASEQHYRFLASSIPQIVWTAEPDGSLDYYNERWYEYTGMTFEESRGWGWQPVLHPEDLQICLEAWSRSVETGETYEIEYRFKRASDGTYRWHLGRALPLRDEDGKIIKWFGSCTDIDDQKRSEESLRFLAEENASLYRDAQAASRAKDEFLATVSHELRTPLNAILGWTQVMRRGRLDEATQARALETIERNSKLQAQLINDVLDVSRIVTGKLRLDLSPVDLAPVIQAAVETVRPAADARNVRLQMILDDRACPVLGDPDRLQQVVWNLLTNAIKFTSRKGRVLTRLACVDSQAEITVSDTGCGINPAFLPHVFEQFRQGDSSTSRTHGGLGLGLAIVRHLVESHGGAVHAESAGEGLGATFTVRLPVMAGYVKPDALPHPLPMDQAQATTESLPSLEGLRILIVDDETEARSLLSTMLSPFGAEIETCGSAGEALEAMTDWKPHVLVSDIGMPGVDGYALIRKVRSRSSDEGGKTPAIALTAYVRSEDRIRALAAGFQVHVPKPVELTELVVAIASLAGRTGVY